jgi:hypothetical protein
VQSDTEPAQRLIGLGRQVVAQEGIFTDFEFSEPDLAGGGGVQPGGKSASFASPNAFMTVILPPRMRSYCSNASRHWPLKASWNISFILASGTPFCGLTTRRLSRASEARVGSSREFYGAEPGDFAFHADDGCSAGRPALIVPQTGRISHARRRITT